MLKKHCKFHDRIEYKISSSELETELDSAYRDILNESFEFKIKKSSGAKPYFFSESLSSTCILRKLNDNIARIYKDEQANRNIIVSQIKALLGETCPSWIIKTDIKSFYESINRMNLVAKFRKDTMLSYHSIFLLERLFSHNLISINDGLPRGMNISATLSEIYMREFDRWVKIHDGVFYYARFVDDIVIFTNSLQSAQCIIGQLDATLKTLTNGLTINKDKTQLFDGYTLNQLDIHSGVELMKNVYFEYLGYRFAKKNCGKTMCLSISIAGKKVKKIQTRITLSFLAFANEQDFELLKNRIKFLTGNYRIRKTFDGSILKAGIYFNYSQITETDQLTELTNYYRKILYCKRGKLGVSLSCLTITQKKILKKYCFFAGFKEKINKSFDNLQMTKIARCWKYGKN
jgi:hypothetical protein